MSAQAVLYAAKSTEDRRGSISTQLADGRALAEREGWHVAAEFSDEAFSAYSGDRGPGLAAALAECARIATEDGGCALIVQHSDRLSRGDGKQSKHTVEYALWGLKGDVTIRSVQDPQTFEDLLYAVVTGQRNNEDSKRKSQATKDGLRRAAERGEWTGRILPDGYVVTRDVDDHGRVIRTVLKDPERGEVIGLIWDLALQGYTAEQIQQECSLRKFTTAPYCKDGKRRPFDACRVGQILDNEFYAGIVVHNGETLAASAQWPRYVEPEHFYRLRAERRERGNATRRRVGRPAAKFLLSELARCGLCGGPLTSYTGRPRLDGTRARTYECKAHKVNHSDSAEYCPATPIDAIAADRIVLDGLGEILASAEILAGQLDAGRTAGRQRLSQIASEARREADEADRVAQKAQRLYERYLADGDDVAADINLTAVRNKRADATSARTRLDAALDALNYEPEQTDGDVLSRMWAVLSGQVNDAGDDVPRLNAALRSWFDQFELHRTESALTITPRISATAIARALQDPAAWLGEVAVATHDRATGEITTEPLTDAGPPAARDGCDQYIVIEQPPSLTGDAKSPAASPATG